MSKFRTSPSGQDVIFPDQPRTVVVVDSSGNVGPAAAAQALYFGSSLSGQLVRVNAQGYAAADTPLPANQYGDSSVAKRWVTNDSVYDVLSFGDSTQTYNFGMCVKYLTAVAWIGGEYGMGGDYHNNGVYPALFSGSDISSAWFQGPPANYTTPVASLLTGVVATIDEYNGGLQVTEAVVGTTTAIGPYYGNGQPIVNRLLHFTPTFTADLGPGSPWIGWDDWFQPQAAEPMNSTFRFFANVKGSAGNTLRLQMTGDNYTAANTVHSAAFGLAAAANSYVTVTTSLPSAQRPGYAMATDVAANDGATLTANENIAVVSALFSVPGHGKLIHSWASGGQVIEGYLNKLLAPDTFWNDVLAQHLLGTPLFWVDLGTNNVFNDDATLFATRLRQLIGRFRLGFPGALILLTTSHPTAAEVAPTYFQTACIEVAETTPGVMCIDTWTMSPSYADAQAAGDMADGTHYNVQGNQKWFERLNTALTAWVP